MLVSLSQATPAGATDAKHKQEQLRRDRQAVQKKLDLAKASDAKVEAEVVRLEGGVRRQQNRVDDALRESSASAARVAAAARRVEELGARARTIEQQLVASAVQLYMGKGPAGAAMSSTGSLNDAVRRQAYMELFRARGQEVLDELRGARGDQLAAKRAWERANAEAARRARAEQEEARQLDAARRAKTEAHNALQGRIAELVAETRALAAQEAQIQALLRSASRSSGPVGAVSNVGLAWPLRGPVTSEYGSRWGSFHAGMDIAPPGGTSIRAAKAGTVIYAGFNGGGYGNFVIVDHGNGIATAYAHMASINTSQGASVSQGQTIGTVGSTGRSSGPHLHYEVRVDGSPKNPRSYHAGSP